MSPCHLGLLRCFFFLELWFSVIGNTAIADCKFASFIPCCNFSNRFAGPYWKIAKNRSALTPDTLIRIIANVYGFSAQLGIVDLTTAPLGAILIKLDYHLDLSVAQIFHVDQREQAYKMKYKLTWKWRDCRTLYSALSENVLLEPLVITPRHTEWSKFFRPVSNIMEKVAEYSSMLDEKMLIYSDGSVIYSEVHVSEFACSFDFTDMPFDEQECTLEIGTPNLAVGKVTLNWDANVGSGGIALSERLRLNEWDIAKHRDWEASAVPGDGVEQASITAKFKIKRIAYHSATNYILPSILYWLVSWLGLWIDPAAVPARAAIGIIPVLVMTNKINSLTAAMPPISQTTRLTSFMLMSLCFITLQMLVFGIVHTAGRIKKALMGNGKKDDEIPHTTESLEAQGPAHTTASLAIAVQEKEMVIARRISLWIDFHSRWLFALTYIAAANIILFA